ncbi:Yip1 family protein [Thioclava sp. FR2]|uniref:Yip1 family protein n=1 Tax=Thioclava sp. FR2 TaxID=3445780 RepID=UPI003EBE5762
MTFSVRSYLEFARYSVQEPRDAARQVLSASIPVSARWMGLVLAATVSAITVHFYMGLYPVSPVMGEEAVQISPFATFTLDLVFNLIVVFLITVIGRWRGGTGRQEDALLLVVWLQMILIVPQVLQILAVILIPPLASIIGMASVGLYFWLISHFTAELHGFKSVARVFFGILVTMIAVTFIIAFLMLPIVGQGV